MVGMLIHDWTPAIAAPDGLIINQVGITPAFLSPMWIPYFPQCGSPLWQSLLQNTHFTKNNTNIFYTTLPNSLHGSAAGQMWRKWLHCFYKIETFINKVAEEMKNNKSYKKNFLIISLQHHRGSKGLHVVAAVVPVLLCKSNDSSFDGVSWVTC